MYVTVILLLLFAASLYGISLTRIRLAHIALYPLAFVLIGLAQLRGLEAFPFQLVLACVVAFIVGFRLSGRARPSACDGQELLGSQRRIAPLIIVVIAMLTTYHFSVVGLPIFSNNVEVGRFNAGDSGLFGLPSRAYLYGTILALAAAVAEALRLNIRPARDRWVQIAFFVYLLSRLVSGFKSGLLEVFITIIVLIVTTIGHVDLHRHLRAIVVAAAAAVTYIFVVGLRYQSYADSSRTIFESLETRATILTAEPVLTILELRDSSLRVSRSALQLDIEYLSNRYFGIGDYEPFGFTRLVAAYIYQVPPDPNLVIQPVTITAFAEQFYDLGMLVVLSALLTGLLLGWLERWAVRARFRPFVFVMLTAAQQALLDYVSKGGLVYAVINWGIALFICIAVTAVAAFLQSPFSRARPAMIHSARRPISLPPSRLNKIPL